MLQKAISSGSKICGVLLSLSLMTGCDTGSMPGVKQVSHAFGLNKDDQKSKSKTKGKSKTGGAQGPDKRDATTSRKIAPASSRPLNATDESEFARAQQLVSREGNFAEAKALLQTLAKKESQNSEIFRWLADCQYNLGEFKDSILSYQQARRADPENYFALRGEGFANLHYGHELWNQRQRAAAHTHYREALQTLQQCLRIYPGDNEAMYGRAMAAEGASRKLYVNAEDLLSQQKRPEAEVEARNCIEVIDEGIEAARRRIYASPKEVGPRTTVAGLYLRRATLLKDFERPDKALEDLQKAIVMYKAILTDVDAENPTAKNQVAKCEKSLAEWQKQAEKSGQQPDKHSEGGE